VHTLLGPRKELADASEIKECKQRQMDIKEHMQVLGSGGQYLGMIDIIEGDQIKLTKKDSGDGQHHFLKKSLISGIEGNKVSPFVKAAEATSKAARIERARGARPRTLQLFALS
jgi:hypothetical protein